ncbi:MAG: threonine/serine exporter family protein [Clostridia bacterium]|nr:threonine/serine exporter family protein [Clostridia bacterium]
MTVELIRIYATSFLGTLGFALLLHAPKKSWLPASIIGGVSYTVYIALLELGSHQAAAMFAAALVGSLLAQFCARKMRMIATIFITLSIVSLVPGLGLYRCMEYLGAGRNALGLQAGVSAMIDIMMIALGVGVGSFIFRLIATRPWLAKH